MLQLLPVGGNNCNELRRSVWAKTYQYWGQTYLRVWVHNDFTPADGRADYTTDQWFLK
jgi:hypothetical protein